MVVRWKHVSYFLYGKYLKKNSFIPSPHWTELENFVMQLKRQFVEAWQNEKHYSKGNNTSENPIPRQQISNQSTMRSTKVRSGHNSCCLCSSLLKLSSCRVTYENCCKSSVFFSQVWGEWMDRVLSTGGRGEASPPPQKKKFYWKKNLQLFQIKIFFDDDFKGSVKVTNVQKCDFSQSWTLYFQNFPAKHAPGPPKRPKKFFLAATWVKKFFQDRLPPKQKILDRTLMDLRNSNDFELRNFYITHI